MLPEMVFCAFVSGHQIRNGDDGLIAVLISDHAWGLAEETEIPCPTTKRSPVDVCGYRDAKVRVEVK